jgi:hypothetical protein
MSLKLSANLVRFIVGLIAAAALAAPALATSRPPGSAKLFEISQGAAVCWRYENALGEVLLLKLRALPIGRTSFLLGGSLATEEGPFPIFGNAELLDGKLRASLTLNAAPPTPSQSAYITTVQYAVVLDPATLSGDFEWFAPLLVGTDPDMREFQTFSVKDTLQYQGRRCRLE